MDKKTAIDNLKFTGWLIFGFGIVSLIGTVIYWKNDELIIAILKLSFSIVMAYLGYYWILASVKTLQSSGRLK